MRLTVLGKSPSWQDADGACSSYLVQEDGVTLVLDCGNGAFGKLRAVADPRHVDAVVISHLHADHTLDLVPFAYALLHAPGRDPEAAPPVLHAPPGAQAFFRRVVGAWGNEDLIEQAFALREYALDETLHVGPLSLTFCPVPHFIPSQAVDVRSTSGARFTFSADCGPNDALPAFAAGTDLLLIEATLPEPAPEGGHLSFAEAGEHGRRAQARRLVLTHLTDQLDAAAAQHAAEATFGGPVEIAATGAVYELTGTN
jgi:ribonuclease BN (tRNA processing enzyme)